MSKPSTNTDGKNTQHEVKVLQTKGFSKEGAANIAGGQLPAGAADRSLAQGKPDPALKKGPQSSAEKRLADHRRELMKNLQ